MTDQRETISLPHHRDKGRIERGTALWTSYWRRSTLKREVALLFMWFWGALTIKIFFYSTPELIGALGTPYGIASTMIWLFAAGAFALDSMAKQFPPKGGPETASG